MQKSLSNSADLTGRCSPSLHACFIKKMMKKKKKKDVNTLTAKYTVGFLNPFLLSIFAIT